MNVLVVDDSRTMRDLVTRELCKEGYDVETAEDGVDALKKVSGFQPKVVITDLNMPRMDGLQLTKALRARPETRYIPIIFLTTESGGELRQAAREAGATGWIVKPFDGPKLCAAVRRVSS
ncbi:response regulator [Gluconobacter kanchanaburiensis]|uniref:Response regulator n=1 Tax=Gluconobacter kanchanaburiensis NBRC 103587 TaxID=1307948 RepID=A0A511BAI4_9PROT|nr:response regulator [Gluconobacter kanchanaburiensis]MBF0861056.1 response regulator [Gluconobacter kanchanaburiensis]GBR70299.1 chemotaxis protein CheY [Gluconobacter kanchanaburiensis NBRC 103587]GEK96752.1 response regulator [Gluconobacter kanchanaburiensis NBRC 103587]